MVIQTSRGVRYGYQTLQRCDHDLSDTRECAMVIRPPGCDRPIYPGLQKVRDPWLSGLQTGRDHRDIRPQRGYSPSLSDLRGVSPWLSDLQRGRDHGYQTSSGVATMVIRPPEGSRPWLSGLQTGRDHGYPTSRGVSPWLSDLQRCLAMVIRPPEGSRLWLSDLQRGRDHGYQTSRGVATMVIRPPEGSRQILHKVRGSEMKIVCAPLL
ncbi:hypothetical protein AVEN_274897-1 [Araneus ventricosus]|uniref:Uncharacterized protein n=1 Tax=Araneus ventricosus TaxID=182803 RepID=A0A4Y2TDS3_ARAVE|nr:hypothetical protein AVEN_274897-1 [Araneus ventricosus]